MSAAARVPGIVRRLRSVRTDTGDVEVKAAAGGLPKSMAETLSAFSNGSGGVIILGLSESEGFAPASGFDPKKMQDALSRLAAEEMEPPLRGDIEVAEVDGAPVVVMEVPALDPLRRPSHIKRKGAYEGSFIRGGDGDRRLTAYEVTQMLANREQPRDDAQIVARATTKDLDDDLVQALLARLRSRPGRAFAEVGDVEALVRIGALARDGSGAPKPTLAGLLCLGRYPQQFEPQLFASFVALPGKNLGDSAADGTRFLDNVTCDGTIPQILHTVLAAARRNMRTATVVTDSGRTDRSEYPIEVIRELVVNALLHRDYSAQARGTQVQIELFPDRLVVKSPGGLYGAVTPGQLGVEAVSSTRNAFLAKLLAELPDDEGYPISENRGSGLPRVMTRLRNAGMSPPEFAVSPGHVHITVPQHALLDPDTVDWIRKLGQESLSSDQHIALALMRGTGSVSNEMLRAWGVESHAATTALRDLVERGLAAKFGGRRYATYELTAEAIERELFSDQAAPKPEPQPLVRSRRVEAELNTVAQAIRAGHTTTASIQKLLGWKYDTVIRRINRLLAEKRIVSTAPAHSRHRTYAIATKGTR